MDHVNDAAFEVQAEVLEREDLSERAKLVFCRLLARPPVRLGWRYGERAFTEVQREPLRELARANLIDLGEDEDCPAAGLTAEVIDRLTKGLP